MTWDTVIYIGYGLGAVAVVFHIAGLFRDGKDFYLGLIEDCTTEFNNCLMAIRQAMHSDYNVVDALWELSLPVSILVAPFCLLLLPSFAQFAMAVATQDPQVTILPIALGLVGWLVVPSILFLGTLYILSFITGPLLAFGMVSTLVERIRGR